MDGYDDVRNAALELAKLANSSDVTDVELLDIVQAALAAAARMTRSSPKPQVTKKPRQQIGADVLRVVCEHERLLASICLQYQVRRKVEDDNGVTVKTDTEQDILRQRWWAARTFTDAITSAYMRAID